MKNTEFENLLKQYCMLSDERLKEIIFDNEYTETAKEVAQYVLDNKLSQNDKEEYFEKEDNPSDNMVNYIHQIACDIRFMKNLTIALLVIMVIVNIVIYIKIFNL
jgi:hypothetical protein